MWRTEIIILFLLQILLLLSFTLKEVFDLLEYGLYLDYLFVSNKP